MTVTYHSGKRIQATQADFDGTPAISGGWKEVGRTTLGSTSDTISVTSLPDKRYYMVLSDVKASGYIIYNSRFNSDTGNNYAFRKSNNGGTDAATASTSAIDQTDSGAQEESFVVGYFTNKSDKEKLWQGHTVENSSTGAGNAPSRVEAVGKWANTSNAVSSYQAYNSHSGDYASGSEVVVLGYDPDDTHTDNFWEELADVTLSSAGDNISSGTFSAKKYLWVQTYISDTGGQDSVNMTFNNDTGNNYAFRRNNNGGTDATTTSTSHITLHSSEVTEDLFSNVFIINNSSNEKLVIGHTIQNQTLGAGTAPIRKKFVGKWSNTSSQITEIDFDNNSTGSYDTNSFIKVWGSN